MQIHEVQAVFNDKSRRLAERFAAVKEKLAYQDWAYGLDSTLKKYTGKIATEYGYTSPSFDHVVVHTESKGRQKEKFKIDDEMLNSIVKDNIKAAATLSDREHGFSAKPLRWFNLSGQTSHLDTANFLTYIHEIGHQVHSKAGNPRVPAQPYVKASITKYGGTNNKEWFAEQFIAWVVDADAFAAYDPGGARFIETTLDSALKATPRRKK